MGPSGDVRAHQRNSYVLTPAHHDGLWDSLPGALFSYVVSGMKTAQPAEFGGNTVELDDLVGERKVVPVEFGKSEFLLSYAPDKITMEAFDRMMTDQDTDGPAFMSSFAGAVVALVEFEVKWNVVIKGKPIPTDAKSLRVAPVKLVMSAFRAVMSDQSPNPTTSES